MDYNYYVVIDIVEIILAFSLIETKTASPTKKTRRSMSYNLNHKQSLRDSFKHNNLTFAARTTTPKQSLSTMSAK